MKSTVFILLVTMCAAQAGLSEPLFSQKGAEPTFQELMKQKKIPEGHNSKGGVAGTKVNVENHLVETTPEAKRPIAQGIKIHTLGNSAIPRSDFGKWSRWYQEDGSTQVFRLFKGEENVRNDRANAARIEAFSSVHWKRGEWHQWSGTYTLIKPHGAAIFQAKNDKNDWSVQINMNASGDITLNHRRGEDKVIAKNLVGKPFHIRVRDNGHDYEVFLNGKKSRRGKLCETRGHHRLPMGMYLGKNEVKSDAMIFVSGATVDGKGDK